MPSLKSGDTFLNPKAGTCFHLLLIGAYTGLCIQNTVPRQTWPMCPIRNNCWRARRRKHRPAFHAPPPPPPKSPKPSPARLLPKHAPSFSSILYNTAWGRWWWAGSGHSLVVRSRSLRWSYPFDTLTRCFRRDWGRGIECFVFIFFVNFPSPFFSFFCFFYFLLLSFVHLHGAV